MSPYNNIIKRIIIDNYYILVDNYGCSLHHLDYEFHLNRDEAHKPYIR